MSSREPWVLGLAVLCSASIMGWIVWSERPAPPPPTSPPAPETQSDGGLRPAMAAVDEARVATLRAAAEQAPEDVQPRLSLADLYFGAHRFEEAIPWYDEAIALSPENADASTNLGVSYYYAGQTEQSVAAFERTLEVDPMNQRALLSLGIVRAFGLRDLDGATAAWEQAIEISPESPEGRAARDSLNRIQAAHGSADADAPVQ